MGNLRRVAKSAMAASVAIAGMVLATVPASASSSYSSLILSLYPRVYWQLGEPSGATAFDSSPHHSNAIYQGGPLLGQPGPITDDPATSVQIDGTGQDVVWAPRASYRGLFTVVAWISNLGTTGNVSQTFFDTRTLTAEYSFDFKLSNGKLYADVGDGTRWLLAGPGIPYTFTTGTWYQVAAVVWPDYVAFYVNGTRIGTEHYSSGTPLLFDPSHKVYLGTNARYATERFFGLLGQVAIFLRPLTAGTINNIYQTGVSPLRQL